MKVEVFGPYNPDGSGHPAWEFEMEDGCERVLVTMPGFYRDQTAPKVWGFKGERQVHATLKSHDPHQVWMA